MPSFILTGAPGAGKTAVLRLLEVRGHPVIEEAATDVIALGHALGLAEPWQDHNFIGKVLALQRRRQESVLARQRARQESRVTDDGAVVFFDRSPVCTLALSRYLGASPSPLLAGEVDRAVAEGGYETTAFFIRNQGNASAHRGQADQLRGLAPLRAGPRADVRGAGVSAGGGARGAARRPRRADQADGRPAAAGRLTGWSIDRGRPYETSGSNHFDGCVVHVDEAGGRTVDGRLMADLGRIWQVSGRLSWVEREVSDASTGTGGDGAFLGSGELAAALQSCVNGWRSQREALLAQLSSVARLSALAASSYEKTDAQLAAVLEKAMGLP